MKGNGRLCETAITIYNFSSRVMKNTFLRHHLKGVVSYAFDSLKQSVFSLCIKQLHETCRFVERRLHKNFNILNVAVVLDVVNNLRCMCYVL